MKKNRYAMQIAVRRVCAGEITISTAAKISNYSYVQIWHNVKQYKIYGEASFIHKNTGRTPATAVPYNIKRKIVSLYHSEYEGLNFSFFAEQIAEDYNINYDPKTIYNILTQAGIKSPENRKTKQPDVHRPRARRQQEGELLQIDATPYQWFSWCGDNAYYAMHGGIDDATGKLTGLYITKNECLYGYAELLRRTYKNGGYPMSIYSDRSAIFCVTPKNKNELSIAEQLKGLHEKRTQWQRILDELSIEQILAWSPQGKGRVERVWRTLQGRLPFLFKKKKIKTMEEANIYLEQYVDIFNKKFARVPALEHSVYHPVNNDIDYTLCARYSRRVQSSDYFTFEGYKWQIVGCKFRHAEFELCVNEHGIRAYYKGRFYDVELRDQFYGETTTQVLENIIYKYYLQDMKKIA